MNAQEKVTNNVNMENKKSTLRFIYPQWQGGIVDHWMPDIPAEDSSRGYFLGVGKGTGSKGASGQAQGLKETTA